MIPAAMKGKFAGQRLVLAQLKQHPDTCALHGEPFGLSAASEGNPTVSFRLIEDDFGDVIGLQLAVSSDDVRKISVGQLMRHRGPFLDRWHDVLLHVKVVPQGVEPPPADVGFVEGWLDGQPFMKGRYGMVDETGAPDWPSRSAMPGWSGAPISNTASTATAKPSRGPSASTASGAARRGNRSRARLPENRRRPCLRCIGPAY